MSRRDHLSSLRQSAPVVLPSLLLCDFANLQREVDQLAEAGVEALHLDVMDGHFVPNFTYGMTIVESLRQITDMTLDVHLMISDPSRYARQFYDAGADIITFHVEAVDDPRPLLTEIRQWQAGAGLALNPKTPLTAIEGCLDLCDLVLVMSVEAGFGGQTFDTTALDKLRRLRELVSDDVLLEVDGGINEQTIGPCAEAGAQLFVAGSAIFRAESYHQVVPHLASLASSS